MQWDVLPYEGIGPLRFGMTLDQASNSLGERPEIIETPDDSDVGHGRACFRDCVFVDFDRDGVCPFFEVAEPIEAVLLDQVLFEVSFERLLAWFIKQDKDMRPDESGLISPKFGVALYAPHCEEEPKLPTEGVAVFTREYFEEHYAKKSY